MSSVVVVRREPSSVDTVSNGTMQALTRPGAIVVGSGGVASHARVASTQRGANAHPGSGVTGLGTDPASAASLRCRGGVQGQPGSQQAMSVGMSRLVENVCGRPDLGDAARVEHCDAVRDLGRDPEVVGDEHDAATDLVAQSQQQPQHLRLHGDVERRGRLVGDDQLWVTRDRDRDHHALPKPTGKLVRIGPEPALGVRNADRGEQLERLLVAARGLGDLLADPHGRVQRRHRILEDGAEIEAADLAQCLGIAGHHVGIGDLHRAADPRLREQPEHGEPEDALARSRFADQAEDLAGCDVEGHAAQCVHVSAVAAERDVQIGDRRHARSVGCRIRRLPQPRITHYSSTLLAPPACHLTVFMALRGVGCRWRNQSRALRNRFVSRVSVM